MPRQREHPYIWTTWLPRLLTGENSCEWAIWFKAHYQGWDRVPSDFNQTDWLIRHTSMLNEQKAQWEDRGHDVYVENQNSFQLTGETATLAGKPDPVVVRDDDAQIVDVKSGKEQPSHRVQLMIYMYALPRAMPQCAGVRLRGEIVYPDRTVQVPPGSVHGQFVDDLGSLIRRLAADRPPRPVPSTQECRFCDITAYDCPDRLDDDGTRDGHTTGDS